jgi:hypothetical protein
VATDEKFILYDERPQGNIRNFVPSGFMGDSLAIKYQYNCKVNPYSGTYCQMWSYQPTENDRFGWAGLFWQNPANNWGNAEGGFDLSKYSKFTFWARGQKGGEVLKFQIGGIRGDTVSDSTLVEFSDVVLTPEWKQYTINLKGENLSCIIGGFCWMAAKERNPEGCTFYLDNIMYE